MSLLDLLAQAVSSNKHDEHFNDISQKAPSDVLAQGLSAAFGSSQTPPIGNMVAQLFGGSNGAQQAGMLNSLMGALGPTVLAGLAGGALSKIMAPGQTQITPEQAAKLTPAQVQDVVNHANDAHPGVADQLGNFYAEHRGLINTLGGLAATIALTKMKDHMTNGNQQS
jgi:hypothetical protein